MKKRITSIGAARLINQNTAAYFGGAVVKKANNIQDVKKLSTFKKKMKMTKKRILRKIKINNSNLRILDAIAANNLVT